MHRAASHSRFSEIRAHHTADTPASTFSHPQVFYPNCIARALRVSKSWWNIIIDTDPVLWCGLGVIQSAFAEALVRRRQRANLPRPDDLSLANPYKVLLKSRYLTRTRWINNPEPKHLTFPAHGRSVVTRLLLSRGRIITASDDHSIHVYSPVTGLPMYGLQPHSRPILPHRRRDPSRLTIYGRRDSRDGQLGAQHQRLVTSPLLKSLFSSSPSFDVGKPPPPAEPLKPNFLMTITFTPDFSLAWLFSPRFAILSGAGPDALPG
jgi:hypothetical protein